MTSLTPSAVAALARKPFDELTIAEKLALANHRATNRAAGRPLDAGAPASDERAPVRRCFYCRAPLDVAAERCAVCHRYILEDTEQADVVKLYRAFGCTVYSTSQKRAARVSEGIPDLMVFHPRTRSFWFHEAKRAVGGRYSPAQQEFRDLCRGTDDVVWTGGGVLEARRMLVEVGAARWADQPDGDIETTRELVVGA